MAQSKMEQNIWCIKIVYKMAVIPILEFSALPLMRRNQELSLELSDSWQVYSGSRGSWCNSLDESADDESR